MAATSCKNNLSNCWNTLRACAPQREDETCLIVMVKNAQDWAISSEALTRGTFNDYPGAE